MAIREWLWKQEPVWYCDGMFKLVPWWDKRTKVLGVCVQK